MNNDFNLEMQIMLTEMLKWFHDFCLKNSIRYFVVGGTMLGAIRHQGFIPWDDDIDVGLPRQDYLKLIKLLKGKQGRYILESPYDGAPDFFYTYSKIYDTNTTLVENTRCHIKRGVFLDVFPLDGVNDDDSIVKNEYAKINLFRKLLIARTTGIRKGRNIYNNAAVIAARMIPAMDEKKLQYRIDRMCQKYDYDVSKKVGNLMSPYKLKEVMDRSIYGNPTLYRFENIEVFGAEMASAYLEKIYGSWKQLPPVDKRVTHHDYVVCDLHKSYLRND